MNTNLSIKCWAEDDRPREKMLLKGKSVLSDAELIAILIGSGTTSKSAVQLAQEMLHECNNDLQIFGRWNITDLKKFKGIGEAKAVSLLAAIEFGRRRKDTVRNEMLKITQAQQVFDLLQPHFMDLAHEEFHCIFLNRANRLIASKRVSVGGLTSTIADGKIIFREALMLNACGVILAHNHPSGALKPSQQDVTLTKECKKFGELIGLHVLDHVIFAENSFFSLAENDMM